MEFRLECRTMGLRVALDNRAATADDELRKYQVDLHTEPLRRVGRHNFLELGHQVLGREYVPQGRPARLGTLDGPSVGVGVRPDRVDSGLEITGHQTVSDDFSANNPFIPRHRHGQQFGSVM